MKSMLHEGSSVSKAIEKAWTDAGKPTEFTIKVLEAGEKNFLGMSKRPAIVSITYDPRRQSAPAKQPEKKDTPKNKPEQHHKQPEKKEPASAQNKPQSFEIRKPQEKKNVQPQPKQQQHAVKEPVKEQKKEVPQQKPPQAKPQPQAQQQQQKQEKETKADVQAPVENIVWTQEWVDFVSAQLNELLTTWGKPRTFTTSVDKKCLSITLNSSIHENQAEERAIFMSFSYLLMQFLKRNHKKKFRGFQLVLTTKK